MIITHPVLRRGARGQAVADLQDLLSIAGHDPGAADGAFGPATEAAVRGFQAVEGLTRDGVVGPLTWAALEHATGIRIAHGIWDRSRVHAIRLLRDRWQPRMLLHQPPRTVPTATRQTVLVAAINGGHFFGQTPTGPTVHAGKVLNDMPDYKGNAWAVLDVDRLDILANPGGASRLVTAGRRHCLASIPRLVTAGRQAVGGADAWLTQRQPRAAIGWDDQHIWLVGGEGRLLISAGVTLESLADLMLELGCLEAMALDGGGSACVCLRGRALMGGGRAVPTMIGFERRAISTQEA